MIHVPPRNRGLGVFMVQDGAGNVIDCDSIMNFFNSACWGIFGGTGTPVTTTGAPTVGAVAGSPPPGATPNYQVDCTQLVNQLNPATGCPGPATGFLAPYIPLLIIGGIVLLIWKR